MNMLNVSRGVAFGAALIALAFALTWFVYTSATTMDAAGARTQVFMCEQNAAATTINLQDAHASCSYLRP